MGSPALVDKIEIQVLVDNATDSLSTIPAHAQSEFAVLERHGMRELSGDSLCCACHGLVPPYHGYSRCSQTYGSFRRRAGGIRV